MGTGYRIALVTGASSGIGEAIVRTLVAEGLTVLALARRGDRLIELARAAPRKGCIIPIEADVRDRPAWRRRLWELPDELREIDVLVNNAGLALGLAPAESAELSDWDQMLEVNCSALAALTRYVLPGMVKRKRGHILMMGSVAGAYAYPGGNVYGATKAFVEQFARNLRADLLGTGVRVTNIEPGLVGGSEFSIVRFKGDGNKASAVYAGTQPLLPADVAEAVRWALAQPAHVNINSIELMPVCQAHGPFAIHRT